MPCSSPSRKLVWKPLGPQFPRALLETAKETRQEQAPQLSFAGQGKPPGQAHGRGCQLRRGSLRLQEAQKPQGLSRIDNMF